MRKKYFRYALKVLKNLEEIKSFKYLMNLRIFKTTNVTIVLVNKHRQGKVAIYYYYMPEELYLGYDSFTVIDSRLYFKLVNYIKREINRIENDEIYRKFRIEKFRNYSAEGED